MLQRLLCTPYSLLQCHYIIHMVFGCLCRQHLKRKLTLHQPAQPSNHRTNSCILVWIVSDGETTDCSSKRKSINFFYIRIHLSALEVYLSLELDIYIYLLCGSEIGKNDELRSDRRKEEVNIGIESTIRTK